MVLCWIEVSAILGKKEEEVSDNEEMTEPDEARESEDKDTFLIRLDEEGVVVFNLYWDNGAPFPGAGHEVIYLLDDKYWRRDSDNQIDGPYGSLDKALDTGPLGSATEAIHCEEYSTSQLAGILDVSALDVGQQIEINEELWAISEDGRLERIDDDVEEGA